MSSLPFEWLTQAQLRLEPHILQTPLTYDKRFDIYLKWENTQRTGSIKIRGALNKILSLDGGELANGVVAASAGNHGQGVALAAKLRSTHAIIVASNHAVETKLDAMRSLGAEVRLVAGGYEEAEATGIRLAEELGAVWVSPYNDAMVIAGQGTIGLDIIHQLPIGALDQIQAIVTPIGGGGLAAGIGTCMREHAPHVQMIGAQALAAPYFHAILTYGTQTGVVETDSLADGLSGAVQDGAVTIPMVKALMKQVALVSEDEIGQAIAYAWLQHGQVIEGSAAVALAAVLTGKVDVKPAVVVLSGGNIVPAVHTEICQRWAPFWGSV